MAKTEVYSWRVSSETKAELERVARRARQPIGSLLDRIVGDWIGAQRNANSAEEEEQTRLHKSASRAIGVLSGGNPRRSEQARQAIRARLPNRHARGRTD